MVLVPIILDLKRKQCFQKETYGKNQGRGKVVASLLLRAWLALMATRSLVAIVVFAAVSNIVVTPIQSEEIDPISVARVPPSDLPIVWENLEANEQWVGGAEPRYDSGRKLHLVCLQPGQFVECKLLPRAVIRVQGCHAELTTDDIEVWTSDGSFIYQAQKTLVDRSTKSLVAVPDSFDTSLVRIVCPETRSTCIVIAVFTSRHIELPYLDGYQCDLVDNENVTLTYSQNGDKDPYALLLENRSFGMNVVGPAWIRTETRLQYKPTDTRSFQPYRLYVSMDGALLRVVEMEPRFERFNRMHVDGREMSVSTKEHGYVFVPAGEHHLAFEATACCLFRAHRFTDDLCKKMNRPFRLPHTNRPLDSFASIWQIPDELVGIQPAVPENESSLLRVALRSARDNRFRNGGVRGYEMMRAVAATRPDRPEISRIAQSIRGIHSYYRDLLPLASARPIRVNAGYFCVPKLRHPEANYADVRVAESMLGDSLKLLSHAGFCPVSRDMMSPNRYLVPNQAGPTRIRIAVKRNYEQKSMSTIWVQFADQMAVKLAMNPSRSLGEPHFRVSTEQAVLTALDWQHESTDSGTLGGPFAMHRQPGPIFAVGTTELRLPGGIDRIQVWTDDPAVELALQIRVSREYRLTESAYTNSVMRSGVDATGLMDLFVRGEDSRYAEQVADPLALAELTNHWQTLKRRLNGLAVGLGKGLRDFDVFEPSGASSTDLPIEEIEFARRLIQEEKWVQALEAWSDIGDQLTGPSRLEGIKARVYCLRKLRELLLMKVELTGRFLYDPDEEVKRYAEQALLTYADEFADDLMSKRVLAKRMVQDGDIESAKRLAEHFAEDGDFSNALIVALLIPEQIRPQELMCRATFHEEWWETFADSVDKLVDPEAKNFWAAMFAFRTGRYDDAERYLTKAGERGAAYQGHWLYGRKILQQLRSPDESVRWQGIREWEAYSKGYPGNHIWKSGETRVVSTRSQVTAYSPELNAYSNYLYASKRHPSTIEVQGPTKIRVRARPLFRSTQINGLDDWIFVELTGRKHLIPVNNNKPSDSVVLVGSQNMIPGRLVTGEITVGPGRHLVRISSETNGIITQVDVERPELPLPVLPPLCPDTVDAVVERGLVRFGSATETWPATKRRLHRPSSEVRIIPIQCTCEAVTRPAICVVPDIGCNLKAHAADARNALRFRQLRRSEKEELARELHSDNGELNLHDSELILRYGSTQQIQSYIPSNLTDVPENLMAAYMARGEPLLATDVPDRGIQSAAEQRAVLLTYVAEMDPTKRLAVASWLFTADRNSMAFQELRSRGMAGTTWKILREFDLSAGVHSLKLDQWTPESETLRVRAAMMGRLRKTSYALSNSNELQLAFKNSQPTQFEIVLLRPQISYLDQLDDLEVAWRIDSQPEQTKFLSKLGAETRIAIPFEAGNHKLALRLKTPRVNHFVMVHIREKDVDVVESTDPLVTRDRFFQVATEQEPVEFNVLGPTVVRVEEFDDRAELGNSNTKYIVVNTKQKTISLPARENGESKLYRIAELAIDTASQQPPVYSPPPHIARIDDAWIDTQIRKASVADGQVVLTTDWISDYFVGTGDRISSFANLGSHLGVEVDSILDRTLPLGQHEDGTWAIGSNVAYRRAVEESELGSAADRYAEFFATHHFFDQWQDRFTRNKFLSRWRDGAGPSFGWIHDEWWDVSGMKPHEKSSQSCDRSGIDDDLLSPFGLRWNAYAFLQDPGGTIAPATSRFESSIGGRIQLRNRFEIRDRLYHTPTATLFARWLSLDENRYQPGHLDQDIFTPYKRNHPVGIQAFDRIVLEPCADVRLWVMPTVSTNTDFNVFDPDYITLRTGMSQKLRGLHFDVSYRWGRYFRDEDRRSNATQHLLYADVTLERWKNLSRRWELGFRLRQDLADGDRSVFITFTDFHSHGREYRDIHSSQLPFAPLRRQRAIDDFLSGIVEPN